MNRPLAALLLSSLALALPRQLAAQEAPAAPPQAAATPADQMVTMQFPGGTLAEFVAAVRQAQPKANVVLATSAGGATVPPLLLKNAGIEQALEGAAMAAEADFEVRVKEFKGVGWPVYSIVAYERPAAAATAVGAVAPKGPIQHVFALNELTGKQPFDVEPFSVATILGALKLAIEDERNPPNVRYHEDSGLLLVRGTREQLQVVELLLSTMRRDIGERMQRAQQLEQQRRLRAAEQAGGDNAGR
jgi:hypothetical protein